MNTDEETQFKSIKSDESAFQKTIADAQSSLTEFKTTLENLPEDTHACVKK